MQHPRMIVLGLVAMGQDYGLAMEQFVERSRMRLWAKIGSSTIYKALKDLEKDGCLEVRFEEAKRGPGKKTYTLTDSGSQELIRRVGEALLSDASVYSDRIAGMVFAISINPETAGGFLDGAVAGMASALEVLEEEKRRTADAPLAQIVLDFYRTVYEAERVAIAQVRSMVA